MLGRELFPVPIVRVQRVARAVCAMAFVLPMLIASPANAADSIVVVIQHDSNGDVNIKHNSSLTGSDGQPIQWKSQPGIVITQQNGGTLSIEAVGQAEIVVGGQRVRQRLVRVPSGSLNVDLPGVNVTFWTVSNPASGDVNVSASKAVYYLESASGPSTASDVHLTAYDFVYVSTSAFSRDLTVETQDLIVNGVSVVRDVIAGAYPDVGTFSFSITLDVQDLTATCAFLSDVSFGEIDGFASKTLEVYLDSYKNIYGSGDASILLDNCDVELPKFMGTKGGFDEVIETLNNSFVIKPGMLSYIDKVTLQD
ncbi:hypothetical protein [Roseimaritima ulvae]|uniref:Uncharacterized protein n=1 Tax=Roseimaritima ulvae TaxID=980254 RepID=A0A5B9QU15_9BACT|nr:hypothetical protein [Roseimaritima ulvae]QEG40895.1 hypothetical protein UC8_29130 [Roseimaritima ulvae]